MEPAWPVLLGVSLAWIGCCIAITWVCIRDLTTQYNDVDKHGLEHPTHALSRRNSHENENVYDILAEQTRHSENHDYLHMLDDGHFHEALSDPIPMRYAQPRAYHPPSRPPGIPRSNYAATSTAPPTPIASRPILACSEAHD